MACANVAGGACSGIILAIRSPAAYGRPMTRAASRVAARAAMVPKVMIWAT